METEENLTCLHIKLYHPDSFRGQFGRIPQGRRHCHSADEPLRFGRDPQVCTFELPDNRVSRKQLALQAFRAPVVPDMLFALQNLSQKGRMLVDGSPLGFLERAELGDEALIAFGEYEMLVRRERGEAKDKFEVEFEILRAPPSAREMVAGVPGMTPVPETGSGHGADTYGFPAELSRGPLETDETLMWRSSTSEML